MKDLIEHATNSGTLPTDEYLLAIREQYATIAITFDEMRLAFSQNVNCYDTASQLKLFGELNRRFTGLQCDLRKIIDNEQKKQANCFLNALQGFSSDPETKSSSTDIVDLTIVDMYEAYEELDDEPDDDKENVLERSRDTFDCEKTAERDWEDLRRPDNAYESSGIDDDEDSFGSSDSSYEPNSSEDIEESDSDLWNE